MCILTTEPMRRFGREVDGQVWSGPELAAGAAAALQAGGAAGCTASAAPPARRLLAMLHCNEELPRPQQISLPPQHPTPAAAQDYEQCSSSSPAAVHSAGRGAGAGADAAASAAAAPRCRWKRSRSVTPLEEDDGAAGSQHSKRSNRSNSSSGSRGSSRGSSSTGPITPAPATTHAALSPAAAQAAPSLLRTPGARPAAANSALKGTAAALWARIQSFMECVLSSPLLQSALLSLEVGRRHPSAAAAAAALGAGAVAGTPEAAALQWTLSQLLALHLRSGYLQATEVHLLASLWVLESFECVWRSPATVCISGYLKHLAAISPQAVVDLTADWDNNFRMLRRAVVDAQMDMLKRLDWRVRVDDATEAQPCHSVLFQPAMLLGQRQLLEAALQGHGHGSAAACSSAGAGLGCRELWSLRIHDLCANIRHQAALLHMSGCAPDSADSSEEVEQEEEEQEQGQGPPTKRHLAAM